MSSAKITFNKPFITGDEIGNIIKAYNEGQLAGDGSFAKECHYLLENKIKTPKAL